jgi:hypothetical protein
VLQNDFDRLELAAEFPGQPVLAYFELCTRDSQDTTELVNNAATLASAGYEVDAGWLSEKTGIKFAGKKITTEAQQ